MMLILFGVFSRLLVEPDEPVHSPPDERGWWPMPTDGEGVPLVDGWPAWVSDAAQAYYRSADCRCWWGQGKTPAG
jgi:hypothetical protein